MRVPVYERQGNINPRQAAQVSPLMPAGDYGASVAQNVAGLATRLQQMQDATQDARTLELFNKFKADSQEYHENPDKGLYNTRQGYMAQGMYAEADEWLRKRGEEYARTIKSDRAKKNFRTMAEQYIQQRGAANSRYEADQVKKYQVEQAQIAYKNGLNEIALNPYDEDAITPIREHILDALELQTRYSSPEVKQSMLSAMENDIASARFTAMMQDNPELAAKYFEANKELFNAQSRMKFDNALEVYRIQAATDKLVQEFPQGNEQEALNYIRENFSGERETRLVAEYKARINEQEILTNREASRIRKQQDAYTEQLIENFYTDGVLPSEEQITQLIASQQIRPEHADKIRSKRDTAARRSIIEKRILSANPNYTQLDLDKAVMRQMGITQRDYHNAFTYAVSAYMNEEINDQGLKGLYDRGLLTQYDIQRIKKNVKSLDETQKDFYKAEQKDLENTIKSLVNAGFSPELVQGIRDTFTSEATRNLNPRSKTYREDLLNLKRKTLIDAIDDSGARKKGRLWGLTDIGEIYENVQNETLESRGINPQPPMVDLKPLDLGLNTGVNSATQGNSNNIALNMVKGGKITGKFSDYRKYRKGQHNGIDIAAPEGTNILMPDIGIPLTVAKVQTSTPSKGAGNYVVLSGTYPDGTNIEMQISHCKRSSINVDTGQEVNAGTLIAKVGNTGMTSDREKGKITAWYEGKSSGYHMDLKIKVNGKYVDPATFKPPVNQSQTIPQRTPLKNYFTINFEDL